MTPDCDHSWMWSHLSYGKIGRKQSHQYEGDERTYRYREMWQVYTCTECGGTRRESDEYYGEDMDSK